MKHATTVTITACFLAGCAAEEQPVTLPPLSPNATATPATTAPTPTPTRNTVERDDVHSVYVGAAHAYHRAQSLPPSRQRAYLATWETDPLLSQDLATLRKARKAHYTLAGRPVLHIVEITIDGDTATVEDCVDHSRQVWRDTRTGRAIAGSRQRDGVWAFTMLTRTAGGWRASSVTAKQQRCDHD